MRRLRRLCGRRARAQLAATLLSAGLVLSCRSSSPKPSSSASAGRQAGGGTSDGSGSGGSSTSGSSTGGSTTGGSSTGGSVSPVAMPPVTCDGLAAKIGVWEDITPTPLRTPSNNETYAAVVDPTNGTLFIAGGNQTNGGACPPGSDCPESHSGVLRSSDCGASFERVNADSGDSGRLMTGTLWAMVLHPKQPEIMYVVNGYGDNPTVYKSTDAGRNWRAQKPDPSGALKFVQALAIDASDGNHLAITWHENCNPPQPVWCFSRTIDGGENWQLFDGPTSIPGWDISGWMEGSSITILGKTSYIVSSPAGIWFTADTGASWKQVAAEIVYVGYAGATTIAGGNLFVAGAGHVLFSKAAPGSDPPFALTSSGSLDLLANSPLITALITDGETIFAGNMRETKRPFWTAPVDDPEGWQETAQDICRGELCRGPNTFAHDPVHHVLYAANWGTGLWRYVIK